MGSYPAARGLPGPRSGRSGGVRVRPLAIMKTSEFACGRAQKPPAPPLRGAEARKLGPRFWWRSAHKEADFGPTGGFAICSATFGESGSSDFVDLVAICREEYTTSLVRRGFRPKTGSEIRGPGRTGRSRGFGGDLLTNRPIAGHRADLRCPRDIWDIRRFGFPTEGISIRFGAFGISGMSPRHFVGKSYGRGSTTPLRRVFPTSPSAIS